MKLGVNIDHVATLRQARLAKDPDLIRAAVMAEMAGANGITIHLREDRRHIQDEDVRTLRKIVRTRLNLEMATAPEIVDIALEVQPDMVTLVPEKREELTTEGGLDILDANVRKKTDLAIKRLHNRGIQVSLFIDPKVEAMKVAKQLNAEYVEIHTGSYSEAKTNEEKKVELSKVIESVKSAKVLNLKVNAGHGLDYANVSEIAKISEIEELNIGHSIIGRSVFVGLDNAVKEMKELMENARNNS